MSSAPPTSRRIGPYTVSRIIETETTYLPLAKLVPSLSPDILDEHRHWLYPNAIDGSDQAILCFQSYVVRTANRVVLIDSCIGNEKDRPGRPKWHRKTDNRFLNGLAALGLCVDDIDLVICTHLHPDHVGWNTRLEDGRWVPTFPNARYAFGAEELAHWSDLAREGPVPAFNDSVLPIIEAGRSDVVAPGDRLDDGLHLVPTPGHTPGHLAIALGAADAPDVMMLGDVIHSPLQMRYPHLSMVFDSDPSLAAVTRRSVLETLCGTKTLCCPAHFPSPSMHRVGRWEDGFRCEPV